MRLELTQKGIGDMIARFKTYDTELHQKADRLVTELCKVGVDEAKDTCDFPEVKSGISFTSEKGRGEVISHSREAVFVEFGTGVKWNGPAHHSPHPQGEQFDLRIGEYGLGQGANPEGWWFGHSHTYGIRSRQYMYRACQKIKSSIGDKAREVFND